MNKDFTEYEKIILSQVRQTLVAVELLDINERPIGRIEGYVIDGSISIDGDSNIRRTASLNFITTDQNYKILETSNIFSINKKIKISIGIIDLTNPNMKKPLWIKMGIFVMSKCTSSATLQGQQINIVAQDKMCLHNGEVSGKLEYTTRLDSEVVSNYNTIIKTVEEDFLKIKDDFKNKNSYINKIIDNLNSIYSDFAIDNFLIANNIIKIIKDLKDLLTIDTAQEKEVKACIKQISENLSNLNVDVRRKKLTIREIIRYSAIEFGGEMPGKVIINDVPDKIKTPIYLNADKTEIGYKMIKYIYPEELTLNTGQPVTTIYEKCKEALGGNYEFFYDLDGNFIFQEIKNYINNNIPPLEELNTANYKYSFDKTPVQFDFSRYNIETNYTVTPNWDNIKNDFYVWGKNEDSLIGYHAVIDDKPTIPNYVLDLTVTNKQMDWREYIIHDFDIGQDNNFVGKCYEKDLLLMPHSVSNAVCCVIKNDKKRHYMIYKNGKWEELLLSSVVKSLSPSPYYKELSSLWKNDRYEEDFSLKQKSNYNFNFDILEGDMDLSKFSVKTIGRRKEPYEDENIKQLYPTIVEEKLVYYNDDDLKYTSRPNNAIKINSLDDFKKYLPAGNIYKDAFSTIKKLLYRHTTYNEQVQINSLPIYNLDVNRRCYVYFQKTNTNGYYIIKKINFNLNSNGVMSVSIIKTEENERNNQ